MSKVIYIVIALMMLTIITAMLLVLGFRSDLITLITNNRLKPIPV